MKLPGEAESLSTPRVNRGVVAGVQDTSAVAIAQAGRQVVGATDELHRAFEEKQFNMDKLQAEDLLNQAVDVYTDLKSGPDGFLQKKSSDAVHGKLNEDYSARFKQSTEALYEKAANARTKALLRSRLDSLGTKLSGDILNHVLREDEVWQKEVLKGTASSVAQLSADGWNSKGVVDAQRVRWKDAVDTYAKENGLDKVARDQMYLAGTTDMHKAVIERAINAGNSGYAKLWLKNNRKEIDADTAANLEAMLKSSGNREASQRSADSIYAMDISDSEKLAKAREINDPEVRDATVARIKARIAEDKGLEAQEKSDASNLSWKIIAEGGDTSDIPTTLWNTIEGPTQIALQEYVLKRNEGAPVKTDYQLYYGLQQAALVDPDAFVRLDLNRFVSRLAGPEFKEMIRLQKDILEDGGTQLETLRSKDQIVKQGLVEAGLNPDALDEDNDDGKAARAFLRRLDLESQIEQAKTGEPLSGQKLAEKVDDLSLRVRQERLGGWWPDRKTAAGVIKIEGVPDTMVDDLARRIKEVGEPVTEENIRKLYNFITNPPAPAGPYGGR